MRLLIQETGALSPHTPSPESRYQKRDPSQPRGARRGQCVCLRPASNISPFRPHLLCSYPAYTFVGHIRPVPHGRKIIRIGSLGSCDVNVSSDWTWAWHPLISICGAVLTSASQFLWAGLVKRQARPIKLLSDPSPPNQPCLSLRVSLALSSLSFSFSSICVFLSSAEASARFI